MFEAGSLVLLPFPFSDLSATKRRPVLVLSAPDGYGDFIAMAVSSRPHHENVVAIQNDSLVAGQLPKPSWIRTDRVVTLNAALVVKAFASIKPEVHRAVIGGLCARLQLEISEA